LVARLAERRERVDDGDTRLVGAGGRALHEHRRDARARASRAGTRRHRPRDRAARDTRSWTRCRGSS
jgi:hypothetical protein